MRMRQFWIWLALLACMASANADERRERVTVPVADGQGSARGMDFDVYIRLSKGMTEGELLERAGPPDYQTVDGNVGYKEGVVRRESDSVSVYSTELIVKTFYFFPTTANPFTTVFRTTGGRITNLQRERKF